MVASEEEMGLLWGHGGTKAGIGPGCGMEYRRFNYPNTLPHTQE